MSQCNTTLLQILWTIINLMTLTFNRAAYANLLADVLPQPIRSQSEYERALRIIEASMNKETVSSEEEQLIDLFVIGSIHFWQI